MSRKDRHDHGPSSRVSRASLAPTIDPLPNPDDAHLLTFEVTLEEGARQGAVLGIDVLYEQDRQIRWQQWPLVVVVCDLETHPHGCTTYRGRPIEELEYDVLLAE